MRIKDENTAKAGSDIVLRGSQDSNFPVTGGSSLVVSTFSLVAALQTEKKIENVGVGSQGRVGKTLILVLLRCSAL